MARKNTWFELPEGSGFGLDNLPYGVFSLADNPKKTIGIGIGQYVMSLPAWAESFSELLPAEHFPALGHALNADVLNPLMAFGPQLRKSLRAVLQRFFTEEAYAAAAKEHFTTLFTPIDKAIMHLPVQCGDYTDFYSSRQHAFNVGSMFRGPENALMPNWLHLPVGYHGRSSSLVPSGTPLHRPWGQVKPADQEVSSFSKSKQLDFELEMAYVIGHGNTLGQPIPIAEAESHVWGYCLFNDWSARDIQSWEYVPLGPFLGKNFGSSLSPWVVTPEALTHCRISGTEQSPPVLPYLQSNGNDHFDIQLEVILRTEAGEEMTICRSNTENLYWSVAQQIAHHTVNGCNLNTGDICASGTISGPNPENFGSMLELTWRGTKPLVFPSGAERKFIEDGDTLIMRAFAQGEHDVISFGEVKTTILPAIDYPLSEG